MDALTVNPEPMMDSGMFSISLENIFSSGAFNVELLNPGEYIKNHWLSEVTETLISIPSTTEYHPEGLFSEEIFGRIGTLERMTTLGYIELNMQVIAPVLFATLKRMGAVYIYLMAARVYASRCPTLFDFERVFVDSEDTYGSCT